MTKTTTDEAREERTAVDKAISVLTAFGNDAQLGLGVSELARRAGLSKSTTFRLLGMLERNGVLERAGTAYRLGRVIHELGAQASTPGQDRVRDLLTPFLADLYEATHMTVQLAMLSGSHVVYLNKLEGHQRLRTPSRIGARMPAYCTAVGKMLLAHNPRALEETLRGPRHAWTANTIVEESALREELWKVRQSGVAIDRGESLHTLACVAAPVIIPGGGPIAALSVSGDAASFAPGDFEGILRRVSYGASRAAAILRSANAA
ncbi:MAG: IclR family transcriptional regulator [Microbacterium ginsengisoli]|jgi:DNA-binding IclR family transcriptional regulator|uniref:IclR family transcriptional regulator n=1 Tax=Microbacterium TaxID=33882 RepID=UPI0006F26A55|nr:MULTISPECIES: IclR family transcriptional regulator [Microbacterium]MBN9197194.1 IclR family transcriptional regulator [Microbacterium ginsengisoli]KQR91145.1 IclR family transcriptional regulator [Microbacterium sp. Leaf347]KQS01157.1 IclR family transcriptional regulator [Microbacterium sp. Leaf351]KXC07198.1 IclR family transcriptional regulator [Microbacterium hominis]MBN9208644.1 IclR family transcriptional regulator [Microbacterium ginsengisoli]